MKANGTVIGVLAALGISVTAAIALPLVNVFTGLTTGELMVVRGGISCLFIALLLRHRISLATKAVLAFSCLFGLANFGLYQGVRAWGASPTIVIVTLAPVVNILAKWWRGEKVESRVILSLAGLIAGVCIALNPWETAFNFAGFAWSAGATLVVGIGFEILRTTKDLDPYSKSFWIGIAMVTIGTVTTIGGGRFPLSEEVWTWQHALALVGYGFTGGFLYILVNVIAFEKLETEVASTLAMGETPAVIVGAWLMLGERLSVVQWLGVLIALGATMALSILETRSKRTEETHAPA